MTYKAIGFDWGGVLNGKPGPFFAHDMASLLGVSDDTYKEAYFHHNAPFNKGDITTEELWTRVLDELAVPTKLPEVLKLVNDTLHDKPNHEVISLVDMLRKRGYKVGLLSNNTLEMGRRIRATGLHDLFDVFHISAETGLIKPAPEAFFHLADELGIQPNEMLFIDDSPKSLSTADEVGYTPVRFENYEQLLADLKALGIVV